MEILLVDLLNVFLRSYICSPAMDLEGELIGGTIGFIKSLAKLTKDLFPSKIYIIWESGGSAKRKEIYPEYKENRKPIQHTNRFYGEDIIPNSEENKKYQLGLLARLLKNLPVYQIYTPSCEGDDSIGYLCRNTFKNDKKIIVSSDKDFYQLLNDKTRIYNIATKSLVEYKDVVEKYQIKPENFAIAKSINGDTSDNIPGVDRVGYKTLAKRFDFVNKNITVDDIITESREKIENTKKPLSIYKNIVDSEALIKRNMRLIHLNDGMLSFDQVKQINHIINNYKIKWKRMSFINMYKEFKLDGLEPDKTADIFQYLVHLQ